MEITIGYYSISVYTVRPDIRKYIIESAEVRGIEIIYQDTDGYILKGSQSSLYWFLVDVSIKYSNIIKIY